MKHCRYHKSLVFFNEKSERSTILKKAFKKQFYFEKKTISIKMSFVFCPHAEASTILYMSFSREKNTVGCFYLVKSHATDAVSRTYVLVEAAVLEAKAWLRSELHYSTVKT